MLLWIAATGLVAGGIWYTMFFPGKSFQGPLPPLTPQERSYRDQMAQDLEVLCHQIGPRSLQEPEALAQARAWIVQRLKQLGYPTVHQQEYAVNGSPCANLWVELPGRKRKEEIVVVGAHYDTVPGCPGADDNGTGVVALLALAGRFVQAEPQRTLRFVWFVNEEPPYFQTQHMGSWRYAQACAERNEKIVAMLSLETIGYYRDEPGTQQYPMPFGLLYPSEGNFLGFVGNLGSRKLVAEVVGVFRQHARLPSEAAALPEVIPGVGWSDHWAFWQEGYPALMVTDTAPFRNPYYHTPQDTPDKLDLDRLARAVFGLQKVLEHLALAQPEPGRTLP